MKNKIFQKNKMFQRNKTFERKGDFSGKGFLTAVIFLLCVTGFLVKGTVISQAKSRIQGENEAYHEMEKAYIRETREVLKNEGFENSGVNLTKVIDEEGNRTYTMVVHNSKISRLNEEEQEELAELLKSIEFADETCEFYHEFLVQ